MLKIAAATFLLAMVGAGAVAWSKPAIQTSFNYFSVTGKTPRDIYADLLAHGPQQGGIDALAATRVSFSQHPVLAAGPICRFTSFSTSLDFKVSLPRLAHEGIVPATTRASWSRFAAVLKAHEARHRAIWTGCANRLERQVLTLKATNCQSFKATYTELSRQSLALCAAENELFDAKERLRFLSLPFIRQATKSK